MTLPHWNLNEVNRRRAALGRSEFFSGGEVKDTIETAQARGVPVPNPADDWLVAVTFENDERRRQTAARLQNR